MEYFSSRLGEEIKQADVATWVQKEYEKEHGMPCQDPWREVRRLYQEGVFIKVRKGFYKYDPLMVSRRELLDFSPEVKEEIFKSTGKERIQLIMGKPFVPSITFLRKIIRKQKQARDTL